MSTGAFFQTVKAVQDQHREGELYDKLSSLRERVEVFIAGDEPLPKMDRQAAITRAGKSIGAIMELVGGQANVIGGDAGHGPGHWARDFSHALRLAHDPAIDSSVVLTGLIAGTLHDLGTVLLDRYADRARAVRHAEAGALVVREAALATGTLTTFEADLVAYAIAAHTHYLAVQPVTCTDGVVREVRPFVDLRNGEPFLPVWLPRWADRLDCSGPCFVARHYLTLYRDHYDFGKAADEASGQFYKITYADHMRPLLRSGEEIKVAGGQRTFVEHAKMFANSQSFESPYGKYDRGDMVTLRDEYRAIVERVLEDVLNPRDMNLERIRRAWTAFLGTNIEPSELGRKAAELLDQGFERLPIETQLAWSNGFQETMLAYVSWSRRRLDFLDQQPVEHLRLPGIVNDVREWIRPHASWTSLLSS
jgi:hypothetical protein